MPINNREDSLKKRYTYKLFTNIIGLIISLCTQAIIPRGLGPKAYGDFGFLNSFFDQIISFFDMGTSLGFYTKLSKRPREASLVSFYFHYVGVVAILAVTFVVVAHLTGIYTKLWPGQVLAYVYCAVFLCLFVWINQIMNQMTDAYGLTVYSEVGKVCQKTVGLLLIILLFMFDKLNLLNYFFYNYLIVFLLIYILVKIMKHYGLLQNWKLTVYEMKKYIKEFYQYSHPLFVYSIVGLFISIFDRWLLQIFGGSVQQGFFSLSFQIGAICFLFSGTMTPLMMREFSIAHGEKNYIHMAYLFRRYIPLFYSITAFFSCFIVVHAKNVIYLFGGDAYKKALIAVAIMAFYPVHQTYGQLCGSMFYATDRTRLYRNIGIVFMIIGLPLTYFLIAPKEKFGLNAGATGLAVKMVFIQFIWTNGQLYFNTRFLKLSFIKYLGHQILSVGCLLVIAFLTSVGIRQIPIIRYTLIPNFILSGILYSGIVIIFVYFYPAIIGMKKQDLKSLIHLILPS